MTTVPKARQRAKHSTDHKMRVVAYALSLPVTARVKPTCRAFPGIEPVQVRKWIKALAPLVLEQDNTIGVIAADTHAYAPSRPSSSPTNFGEFSDDAASEITGPAALSRRPTERSRPASARDSDVEQPASPFHTWPDCWPRTFVADRACQPPLASAPETCARRLLEPEASDAAAQLLLMCRGI